MKYLHFTISHPYLLLGEQALQKLAEGAAHYHHINCVQCLLEEDDKTKSKSIENCRLKQYRVDLNFICCLSCLSQAGTRTIES